MTPLDAGIELFDRLAALAGEKVLLSEAELACWPEVAVTALKKQKLISKAQSAKTALCLGCEYECVMPVYTVSDSDQSDLFIVCDKRRDTNRVMIDSRHLRQWQCHVDAVCGFIADALLLRRSEQASDVANRWVIGLATGKKRNQMLCLKIDDACLLVAGGNAVPLVDFLEFEGGVYGLDAGRVLKLVDMANTADERYTPSNARREVGKLETQAMYEGWQKAYRQLKRDKPNMSDVWYAKQIAKMDIGEGRSYGTIKKHMVN